MREFVPRGPLKSFLRRKYADFLSVRIADRIITVSKHSRREICNRWKLPPSRVEVIYEAAGPMFFDEVPSGQIAAVKRKYQLPSEYFLYLGGFDKRKNVGTLVEAYRFVADKLPPLVLAGDRKCDFAPVQAKIEALGLTSRIIAAGRIENEDLPALYQGAYAFIYPSLYEGFGLQLVEAMASGLPVLASERTT